MVKNYILWLVFTSLLAMISATACFAGQNAVATRMQQNVCSFETPESGITQSHPKEENTDNKENKSEEVNDVPATIMNSNVLFYIFYRFKFSGASENMENEDDGDKPSIPIVNFTNRIIAYITNLYKPS